MKVTVITPTLPGRNITDCLRLIKNQQCEWEIEHIYNASDFSIGNKLNQCFSESTGDIIIRADDDDYYAEGYVQHAVETLLKHGTDTIVGLSSCYFLDTLTNRAYKYTWDDISQRYVVGASHVFYRESKFRYPEQVIVKGKELAHGEDNIFCSQFANVVYGDYIDYFVAIKHGRNTSPYNFRDSCYEPVSAEMVKMLMI